MEAAITTAGSALESGAQFKPQTDRTGSPIFGELTLGAIARLDPETLLNEQEAAKVLRRSRRTLERWRSQGSGPRAKKIGPRCVAYSVGALLEFAGVAA